MVILHTIVSRICSHHRLSDQLAKIKSSKNSVSYIFRVHWRSVTCIRLLNTMKPFRIEKSVKVGSVGESRLGTLRLINQRFDNSADDDGNQADQEDDILYTTPMHFIHTQSGSVPHITPEVLKLIYPTMGVASATSNFPPLQISLEPTIIHLDSVKKFDKGIAKFVGLPHAPVFLTVHDSLQLLRSGYNDKLGIALWSRHGRTSLTPELFMQAVNAYKPSLCQILSDYDIRPESSGIKRLKKSLSRAEEYSNFVMKERSSTKCSKAPGLFITIETVWFEMDEQLARKAVATLLESVNDVEGIIIEGLTSRFATAQHRPTSKDSKPTPEPCKVDACTNLNVDLVDRIVKILPSCLPKYIPGPFGLPQMIDLISKGVDIFDSSIATIMADNSEVFQLDALEIIMPSLSQTLERVGSGDCFEELPERCDVDDGNQQPPSSQKPCDKEEAVFALKDKRFFDDFRPISRRCVCYTCRKHTRSYVHHLYNTGELLGPVLVQIHNLTAVNRFFQMVRGILQDSDSPESVQNNLTIVRNLVSRKFSETEIAPSSGNEHREIV